MCYWLFESWARKQPQHTAVQFENEPPVIYAELIIRIRRCANYLRSEVSVQLGEVIGVYLPSSIDQIVLMQVISAVGAVICRSSHPYPQTD